MTINKFLCGGVGYSNTGIPDCEPIPGNFTGAILIPTGTSYTPTQVATFDVTLQDAAKADNALSRIYPIKKFTAMNDNSTEDTTTETGYGDTFKTRDGKPVLQFQLNNGMSSWANLRGFDNQETSWTVLFIDEQNNCIWGRKNASGNVEGFSLNQLSVPAPKWNQGSDPFNYMVTFGLTSTKQLENFALVQFEDDIEVLDVVSGLLEIDVTVNSYSGGVLNVSAYSSGTDLYDLYSTELVTIGAWALTNRATGATITITGITLVPGTKSFDIAFTALSPGTIYKLVNTAPSVLEALPMPGYAPGTPVYTTEP